MANFFTVDNTFYYNINSLTLKLDLLMNLTNNLPKMILKSWDLIQILIHFKE